MPTPNALPDRADLNALIARFRDGIEGLVPSGARLGIAVSGGPDSLALLLLAEKALPGRIAAATVDHGLRTESADEAAMVEAFCERSGIAHRILREDGFAPVGNIQEHARKLRYRLLGGWAREAGISHVALAHHADDVAESFLMRASRGSGVRGLAQMAEIAPIPYADSPGVMIVRPLLGWRRSDLAAIVEAAGLTPAVDPSNADHRYDRSRLRALLAREPDLDPALLARSAANLTDADTALEWLCDQAWRSRVSTNEGQAIRIDIADLPREIRRRLAARAVAKLAPMWNREGIDGLVDLLDDNRAATLSGVKVGPIDGGSWHFSITPPHARHR